MSKKILYYEGQILGKCTFIREAQKSNKGDRRGVFLCVCGKEFESVIREVKSEHTNSCGCGIHRHNKLRKEAIHTYKSEYAAWCSIKYRCHNPSCKDYKHYGGRGIKMCDRWFNSFDAFLTDMGPKPTPKHTVERMRVNEDYGPQNCIWLPHCEQNWNRRDSKFVTYKGETKTLPQWAKELGLSYKKVQHRIRKGFSPEKAFATTEYDSKGRPKSESPKVFYAGEWLSMREASEKSGVKYNTIRGRLRRNIDPISGHKLI